MRRKIQRIFIANRGEIALRITRTCHRLGIETCAGYSEADKNALFVKKANHKALLGGPEAKNSYLNAEKIIEIALGMGCDAVHPGYGFLSENANFARAVRESGLIFIGPDPDTIASMGDKIAARKLMEAAGVPIVPGYHGTDQNPEFLHAQAKKIGFPLLIKAARGGGGRGMRLVENEAPFLELLDSAKREALNAFGDDSVFLERYILQPRHIEVQIFGDEHGNVRHFFERDCSIQRRHQKIIEESPAPDLPDHVREQVFESAIKAAENTGYKNAGTVEFVYSPADGVCYFLEINTRLQVEHPVTEMVTGLDLVELQIRIAEGESIAGIKAELRGHAVEARLYAEDPENDFLPVSGPVHLFHLPEGQGVRVDTGIESGSEISAHYDPMVAKIIGYGKDRDAALDALVGVLKTMAVCGFKHNGTFLHEIASHPAFRKKQLHTGFIAEHFPGGYKEKSHPASQQLALAIAGLLHAHNARYWQETEDRQEDAAMGGELWPWLQHPGFELWPDSGAGPA